VQRNFALRPDLITMPLPAFSGTAAVPSTVDVFVNNVKNFSKDIPPGPFTISNLPIVSGAGTARVVIRETSGRVTETETAFYASPQLLRAGLTDFSAEGGFVRQLYGVESASYDGQPVASGSVRYGVDETLTLEGHAEAGLGLINAGMGLVTQLGTFGVFTLAGSVDHYDGEVGTQIYAGLEADFRGIKFYANTQRQAVGNYIDLATLSGKGVLDQIGGLRLADLKPAKAIDRISMSLPLPVLDTRLNVGFVHTEYASEEDRYLFNTSYSHRLTKRLSLFANGFYDFADDASLGVYAGLSMCLGDWGHGQLSVSQNSDSMRVEATYSKTAEHEPGSFGWRTRVSEGGYANREVSLTYHGSKARVEGTVTQHADTLSGFAYVSGAVAFADGSVFASNRIDDAFAVVDAGVPDVEVFYENRPIGHTGSTGKLLVTGLRSYQRNKISIDPLNLPVNADIPQTEAFVAPADRHGILVKFNIRTDDTSALVTFETVDGKALPVSSLGVVSATEEEFVIGYGGQAFIKNLSDQNEVTIDTGKGMCAASFPFTAQLDTQVAIEKVICR
jgi:outer membrane usher protein